MERVASLEESVEEVRGEVRHNHGGSLKDAVRRIEGAVADLSSNSEN
jgi:hypothetical protein